MRAGSLVVLSIALMAGLVGCGESTPDPKTAPPPAATTPPPPPPPQRATAKAEPPPAPKEEAPPPAPPPPPRKTAKELVTGGSTWMFSLADSADAKKFHQDACEKKSKKPEKVEACMKAVAEEGAKEGIRFDKDEKGAWWYVAFGQDKKGKEVVQHKMAFKIVSESPEKLTVAPDGKAPKDAPKELAIESPDENTVVLPDPKKGKLVFKKK
jgi:hypothetical protein